MTFSTFESGASDDLATRYTLATETRAPQRDRCATTVMAEKADGKNITPKVLSASDVFSKVTRCTDTSAGIKASIKPASLDGLARRAREQAFNFDPWQRHTVGSGYQGNYMTTAFLNRWSFDGVLAEPPKDEKPSEDIPLSVYKLIKFSRADTMKSLRFKYRSMFLLSRTVDLKVPEYPRWTLAVEVDDKLLVSCYFSPNRLIGEKGAETMSAFLLSASGLATPHVSELIRGLDLTGERFTRSISVDLDEKRLGALEINCSKNEQVSFEFYEPRR